MTTIDDYTPDHLHKISRAIWELPEADDATQLRRDIANQLRAVVSLADFAEDMQFAQYETAYSFCHMAYTNGKKASDSVTRCKDTLDQLTRGDFGAEVTSRQIEREEQRMAGYMKRLEYWRHFFAAAQTVLTEVVDNTDPALAQHMTRKWTPRTPAAQRTEHRAARARARIHAHA